MERDEQKSVEREFHTPEDIMMRNQVLSLRIRELEKRVGELDDRVAVLNGEKKMLARRVTSAYIVLFDYDGYYNQETKTGNIEGLASVVDDALGILSGSEDNMREDGGQDVGSRPG